MSSELPSNSTTPDRCPSCGASIDQDAVLCVACGYHLKLGQRLQTEHGEPPPLPSRNPYASPREEASETREVKKGLPEFDLTEGAVKEAENIVSDAKFVWVAGLLTLCFCQPLGPFLLPLYAYRLYQWNQLRNTFEELRYPNAFSPNGKLGGDFEEAIVWLKIGLWIGVFFTAMWGLIGLTFLISQAYVSYQLSNA